MYNIYLFLSYGIDSILSLIELRFIQAYLEAWINLNLINNKNAVNAICRYAIQHIWCLPKDELGGFQQ